MSVYFLCACHSRLFYTAVMWPLRLCDQVRVRTVLHCCNVTFVSVWPGQSEDASHLRTVQLEHDLSGSLGISVAGGLGSPLGDVPIIIANLNPDGPAIRSGKLRVGSPRCCNWAFAFPFLQAYPLSQSHVCKTRRASFFIYRICALELVVNIMKCSVDVTRGSCTFPLFVQEVEHWAWGCCVACAGWRQDSDDQWSLNWWHGSCRCCAAPKVSEPCDPAGHARYVHPCHTSQTLQGQARCVHLSYKPVTLQVTQGHISLYLPLDENMCTSLSQWGRCIHALYHSSLSPFWCGKVCTFLSQWYVTLHMGQGVYISVPWSVILQMGRCVHLSVSHWPVALQVGQGVYILVTVVGRPSGGAKCVHFCHSGLSPFRWGKVHTSLSQWSVTLQVGQSVYISITVVCRPSGGARCVHLYHSGLSPFRWGKMCTSLSQWPVQQVMPDLWGSKKSFCG